MIDLNAIKARLAAATDGPWYLQPNDLIGGWCVRTVDTPPSEGPGEVADFIREEDAALIAHARADLPALVAEVEHLRATVSALRASVPPSRPRDYGHEVWTTALREAAEAERAAVVAWLRREIKKCGCDDDTASCIERGEHRREEES